MRRSLNVILRLVSYKFRACRSAGINAVNERQEKTTRMIRILAVVLCTLTLLSTSCVVSPVSSISGGDNAPDSEESKVNRDSLAPWDWLRSSDGSSETRSATLRNIGLLIAGGLALVLAGWRSWVADRQSRTAQSTLLNERYQRAAEMLGSDVMAVRLGGIYALQSLVEEHPKEYYVECMRLMCAFVRHPTQDKHFESGSQLVEDIPIGYRPTREDVQAVMHMMRDRDDKRIVLEKKQKFKPDLEGAYLYDMDLVGLNLSRANLKSARLSGAYLEGANLSNATLTSADLSHAGLESAKLHNAGLLSTNVTETHFYRIGETGTRASPAQGLTQEQLNLAFTVGPAPELGGKVLDANTRQPIVWRGESRWHDIFDQEDPSRELPNEDSEQ